MIQEMWGSVDTCRQSSHTACNKKLFYDFQHHYKGYITKKQPFKVLHLHSRRKAGYPKCDSHHRTGITYLWHKEVLQRAAAKTSSSPGPGHIFRYGERSAQPCEQGTKGYYIEQDHKPLHSVLLPLQN